MTSNTELAETLRTLAEKLETDEQPKTDEPVVELVVQCFVTYRVDADGGVHVHFDPTDVDFDFLANVVIDGRTTGVGQAWPDTIDDDDVQVALITQDTVTEALRKGKKFQLHVPMGR